MPGLTNFPNGINAGTSLVATTATFAVANIGSVGSYGVIVHLATLTPAAVAPNTSAEQTFAVSNVGSADVVLAINKPTAQAGLGIVGQRVSSAGTVGITFGNFTAGTITPTAGQVYAIATYKAPPTS